MDHTGYINGNSRDAPAVDRRGNQMYCAPESIHHSDFRRTGPNHITTYADIFSAGAVFSDAAAWVAEGQPGRHEYLRLRQEETVGIEGFKDSGYEGAFHNGSGRLDCVDSFHRRIRSTVAPYDKLTSRILEIVETKMLTATPTNRMPANQLYTLFEIEVHKARDGIKIPGTLDIVQTPLTRCGEADETWSPQSIDARSTSPNGCTDDQEHSSATDPEAPISLSSIVPLPTRPTKVILDNSRILIPDSTRPDMPQKRPFTTPIIPQPQVSIDGIRSRSVTTARLSMRDAHKYWRAKKDGRQVDVAVEKIIEELISNLHGRDHFFFIDDTKSMEEHSLQIESTFQTLAYIAKRIDPNNLELSFVSNPLDISEGKHTTPLMKILRQHVGKYTAIEGSIETRLSQLVNKLIMKRLPIRVPNFGEISMGRKPITIFVFTDGKWGNGIRKGNGLDQPIRSLMTEIRKRGLTRTQVMFQFLRFGRDEDGREHLEHLDEFGKRENW
ncbi:hypothetical protein N0V82_006413 [Gnomoniopsis sp. IMI 355080]|nr:hypothetical protein N0V82_006413 [Gnomoniopsis sp. IMI 355080]